MFASEVVLEVEVETDVDVGWSSEDWWVSVASSGRAVPNRHPPSVVATATTNDCLQEVVDTRRRMTTRSSKEWLVWSRVVSTEVPASQQVRGFLASCLVLGAWSLELATVPNQEDRLSTRPGLGGSCFLLGDVWPWLRAELFRHQPSSTPISRHGKGTGPIWSLGSAWSRSTRCYCGTPWLHMAEDSPCLISNRFLACDSGVSRLISSRCHAIHHDDQSLQCHAMLNIGGNWVH